MKYQNMKFPLLAALIIGAVATDSSYYGRDMDDKKNGGGSISEKDQSYGGMYSGDSKVMTKDGKTYKGDGEIETVDIIVLSQNWGADKGAMQMNAPSGGGMVHNVMVGGSAGLVYTPESVNAAVGDMINFTFMSKNHTVTQSAFDKPCVRMPKGVDSGFMPNPDNMMNPAPSFMFEVKVTTPIWFYCKQKTGTHCGHGMVFSINPTAAKSQALFKQMAMQQNGTATGGSSMMQSSSMVAPSSMAASSSMADSSSMSTAMAQDTTVSTSMIDMQTATSTASASNAIATGGSNLAQGSGMGSGGDSCSCTCLCGVGAFPDGAGMGSWGGYGGAIPAPWAAGQMSSPPAAMAGKSYR